MVTVRIQRLPWHDDSWFGRPLSIRVTEGPNDYDELSSLFLTLPEALLYLMSLERGVLYLTEKPEHTHVDDGHGDCDQMLEYLRVGLEITKDGDRLSVDFDLDWPDDDDGRRPVDLDLTLHPFVKLHGEPEPRRFDVTVPTRFIT